MVIPDLNVHVPASRRSAVDPSTKRSFFAVFDGRECPQLDKSRE